jgi:hypothetical protein
MAVACGIDLSNKTGKVSKNERRNCDPACTSHTLPSPKSYIFPVIAQELQALGEAVGSVSRGLPPSVAEALPRHQYSQLRRDSAPDDEQ